MPRVKRGMTHVKKRNNLLRRVKGFEGGRKKLIKLAKTADLKAGAHAYRDRKRKKRQARALWQVKVNAAARQAGTNYSKLISALKAKKINLNRKVLAELAADHPAIFSQIVNSVK